MGFLQDRKILVTGLLSNRSIAYGIARALAREGATLAFTYQHADLRGRVEQLAQEFGSTPVLPCDVASDAEITALFAELGKQWNGLDGIVHSLAFAPRETLKGEFLDALSREAFHIAHDVSAYSFAALAKAGLPLMEGRKAALLTLSYLGAVRAIPNYNVMGVAKASLEATVRYLAQNLGPKGIRVNAISAGPIKTLAASGIGDFRYILKWNEYNTPLRRNISADEVGDAAVYLLSDMSRSVTGEIHHVDAGYHIVGIKHPDAPDIEVDKE